MRGATKSRIRLGPTVRGGQGREWRARAAAARDGYHVELHRACEQTGGLRVHPAQGPRQRVSNGMYNMWQVRESISM